MSAPLTFGVEFEIAFAYLPKNTVDPNPSETRTLRFIPDEADSVYPYSVDHEFGPWSTNVAEVNAMRRHIKDTLSQAGHGVERNGDITKWSITDDNSIEGPENGPVGYVYQDVELVSPAFYFVPESLKAIEDVLALLKNTYVLNINATCGMHVHVGDGVKGFEFDTLKKLVSLLFAFTPQLNTLHPADRQDVTTQSYAGSLRENSRFEIWRRLTDKARPTPVQAVSKLLNSKNEYELMQHAVNPTDPKLMAYNLSWLQKFAEDKERRAYNASVPEDNRLPEAHGFMTKPTIEFRQHEGCLDAADVINWVKVVVGIVDFCRTAPTIQVFHLLEIAKRETWEKLGDGLDAQREAEMGPVLADQDFTAVDLLNALHLSGPALHYARKGLFRHEAKRSLKYQTRRWEYEANPPEDVAELARKVSKRKVWDALQAASKARALVAPKLRERWSFDPKHEMWPVHETEMDDEDTDAESDYDEQPEYSSSDGSHYGDTDDGDSNDGGAEPSSSAAASTSSRDAKSNHSTDKIAEPRSSAPSSDSDSGKPPSEWDDVAPSSSHDSNRQPTDLIITVAANQPLPGSSSETSSPSGPLLASSSNSHNSQNPFNDPLIPIDSSSSSSNYASASSSPLNPATTPSPTDYSTVEKFQQALRLMRERRANNPPVYSSSSSSSFRSLSLSDSSSSSGSTYSFSREIAAKPYRNHKSPPRAFSLPAPALSFTATPPGFYTENSSSGSFHTAV